MIVGAVGGGLYNLVLLVHLLAVIVGAGMAFLSPLFVGKFRQHGGRDMVGMADATTGAIVFPSLLIAGLAGGGLVALSDDQLDFGIRWLAIAGPLWLMSLGLALVAHPPRWFNVFNAAPNYRRIAGVGLHIVLLLLMIDMVWKPT